MKRSNLFQLMPTADQHHTLCELGVNCAKLWNEVNYLHRQQYQNYLRLDWNPRVYKKYVPLVGSATAQQVVRKNNEAWRSLLALKQLERRGSLPAGMKKVRTPGYWKRDGRYMLRILFRCDSYHIRNGCVDLPRRLSIPFKGELKWIGKQGRLEVSWDALSKKWRVFQAIHVKPIITPLGSKTCYIDMGVRNLATVCLTEWRQPIAYQSGRLLADWWYWTNRIARHQQRLLTVNGRRSRSNSQDCTGYGRIVFDMLLPRLPGNSSKTSTRKACQRSLSVNSQASEATAIMAGRRTRWFTTIGATSMSRIGSGGQRRSTA
jgi:putative transposase